jgi:hypothetical protein
MRTGDVTQVIVYLLPSELEALSSNPHTLPKNYHPLPPHPICKCYYLQRLKEDDSLVFKKFIYTCNPSYSRGRDQEDHSSGPARQKVRDTPPSQPISRVYWYIPVIPATRES